MSNLLPVCLVLAVMLIAHPASGDTYLIEPDGSGDFPTIQAAINAASTGDVVELANGVFTGDGNRDLDLLGKEITVRSQSGNPDSCVIDCEGGEYEYHRGFNLTSGETHGSVVGNISIANGYSGSGGGMFCNSSPTITGCILRGNSSSFTGGGIFAGSESEMMLIGCTFVGNYSHDYGGGVFADRCQPTLAACEFVENSAPYGAGIACFGEGAPSLTSCLFTGNQGVRGGAVACLSSAPSFSGCTFVDNTAADGTGIGCLEFASPTLDNCIIAFGLGGDGVWCWDETSTVSLTCCDVFGNEDGDWVGSIADQYGINGNISADPLFCDREGGDFRVASCSPCLRGACVQIGAFGQGCWCENPAIMSICDVGNDQGGQVRLDWIRSEHDSPGEPTITGYGIYRRQDQYLASRYEENCTPTSLMKWLRLDGWDHVTTVPARGDSIYQVVAPTLCDSTADDGICWSAFFVSAMTPDPLVFYDSVPDSGYSVDNLAPEAPTDLVWNYPAQLVWSGTDEPDFNYFSVYGSDYPTLNENASVVGWTVDTTYDVSATIYPFYFVTATDFAGNEGECTSLQIPASVGKEDAIALTFALRPTNPNPFKTSTVLSFDLPEQCSTELKIFDTNGRLVRTLVKGTLPAGHHRVSWDAQQQNGREAAPGVYYVVLDAGAFRASDRLVVLR